MSDSRPRAILADAGFTLVVCDADEIVRVAKSAGVQAGAASVDAAVTAIHGEIQAFAWPSHPSSASPPAGGPRFFRRILELSGASGDLDRAGKQIWETHLKRNVWRRPIPGTGEALASLKAAGIVLGVVSNSEGTIEQVIRDIGFAPYFGAVVDSWVAGVSKPDKRIFEIALERLGARAEETVMVGDSLASDVRGAEAAGIRGVLIDPFDRCPDPSVTRFRSFAEFAGSVLDR